MVQELAEFEKAPQSVSNTVEQMQAEREHFEAIVAETDDGELVGFALYFFAYFTWVGKSLYLDDLYVKPGHRGQQIGSRLLSCVFDVAKTEGCKRVRWQVLDWNSRAIELYKKVGAKLDGQWLNCDFDARGIADFKAL